MLHTYMLRWRRRVLLLLSCVLVFHGSPNTSVHKDITRSNDTPTPISFGIREESHLFCLLLGVSRRIGHLRHDLPRKRVLYFDRL